MAHDVNVMAAIIEIVNSGEIKTVEDAARLAKFASNKLDISFAQGIALVSEIVHQELERVDYELSK